MAQSESDPHLETIGSFEFLPEAELARSRLEAEGIITHLRNENIVVQSWLYRSAVGGLDLQVSSEDAPRAREILGLPEPVEELAVATASPEAESDETCPRCGSRNIRAFEVGRRWTFLSWLILSFPVLRFRQRLKCDTCGLTWKPTKTADHLGK